MEAERIPCFLAAVQGLVEILANQEFAASEQSGLLGPRTADEYAKALTDYLGGRSVTSIPNAALESIELYPTKQEGRFRAEVDIWVDGARSDLTAIVYFDKWPDSPGRFQLYDLRVL